MTVDSTNNRNDYDPDGLTDTFIYSFRVDTAEDMKVYADGELYGEPFAITGLGEPTGGDVIFDALPVSTIEVLTLIREVPLTQETAYPPLGPFPASSHEAALDKLTFIVQQQQEQINRAAIAGVDADPATDYTLPPYAAGEIWLWDATQARIVSTGVATIVDIPVSSIAQLRALVIDDLSTGSAVTPNGFFEDADGGGGPPRILFKGFAPSTFVDNNSIIVVPSSGTGSDGSAAWIMPPPIQLRYSLRWFGGKLDQITDDWAALTHAKDVLAALPGFSTIVIDGGCLLGQAFAWDKGVYLDTTAGFFVVNSNISAVVTNASAESRYWITDGIKTDVTVLSAARPTHTKDLLIFRARMFSNNPIRVAHAGGRGIYFVEEAGSNLNWSNFSCSAGACGLITFQPGFELGSTQGFTEVNSMTIECVKMSQNYAGARIGGGIGLRLVVQADSNLNESLRVLGGAKQDIWLYDDSSNGNPSLLLGGNGNITGVFNNGIPGTTDQWTIKDGPVFKVSSTTFASPFSIQNDAANNFEEGIDLPIRGSGGLALARFRFRGDKVVEFLDADVWIVKNSLRYEQLQSQKDEVFQSSEAARLLAQTTTDNLSLMFGFFTGFYEITVGDGGRFWYGHITVGGVVTEVASSATFGTLLNEAQINIYATGGNILLQNNDTADRNYTIRYNGGVS